jgi:hypothetical protein
VSEICEIGEQGVSFAGVVLLVHYVESISTLHLNLQLSVMNSRSQKWFPTMSSERLLHVPRDVGKMESSYLVDPASSHMLVSKIKPCMSKYKQICTVKLRMAH